MVRTGGGADLGAVECHRALGASGAARGGPCQPNDRKPRWRPPGGAEAGAPGCRRWGGPEARPAAPGNSLGRDSRKPTSPAGSVRRAVLRRERRAVPRRALPSGTSPPSSAEPRSRAGQVPPGRAHRGGNRARRRKSGGILQSPSGHARRSCASPTLDRRPAPDGRSAQVFVARASTLRPGQVPLAGPAEPASRPAAGRCGAPAAVAAPSRCSAPPSTVDGLGAVRRALYQQRSGWWGRPGGHDARAGGDRRAAGADRTARPGQARDHRPSPAPRRQRALGRSGRRAGAALSSAIGGAAGSGGARSALHLQQPAAPGSPVGGRHRVAEAGGEPLARGWPPHGGRHQRTAAQAAHSSRPGTTAGSNHHSPAVASSAPDIRRGDRREHRYRPCSRAALHPADASPSPC